MAKFPRFLTLPIAAVMIVSACGGGGSQAPGSGGAAGGTITVTSLWGGSEQESFQKVLDAFKTKTGITATYQAQRTDYSTVLQSKITSGSPPDVAIMPGLGFLRQFARSKGIKSIKELGLDPASLESNYPAGILDSGKVDGELYGIMVKFNSKSTFWYRPDKLTAAGVTVPASWTDLKAALDTLKTKGSATPLGLGAKDSWTLTDWFENIYVRQAGPEAYDKLFSADGDWTDPSVAAAVKSMTDVLNDTNVEGGIKAALGRGFVDGIAQAFSANPKADMYYEGGFVGGIITGQVNKAAKLGTDADWFDFPSINGNKGVTIGGDVIAAFTTNPGVKEFMEYMTTAEAGAVWAGTGAIISPVKGVQDSVYPNDQTKREAAQVANATAVRFDGSDLLPGGGPNLGAELQKAIQGQTVDWASFQSQIQTAWTNE